MDKGSTTQVKKKWTASKLTETNKTNLALPTTAPIYSQRKTLLLYKPKMSQNSTHEWHTKVMPSCLVLCQSTSLEETWTKLQWIRNQTDPQKTIAHLSKALIASMIALVFMTLMKRSKYRINKEACSMKTKARWCFLSNLSSSKMLIGIQINLSSTRKRLSISRNNLYRKCQSLVIHNLHCQKSQNNPNSLWSQIKAQVQDWSVSTKSFPSNNKIVKLKLGSKNKRSKTWEIQSKI